MPDILVWQVVPRRLVVPQRPPGREGLLRLLMVQPPFNRPNCQANRVCEAAGQAGKNYSRTCARLCRKLFQLQGQGQL